MLFDLSLTAVPISHVPARRVTWRGRRPTHGDRGGGQHGWPGPRSRPRGYGVNNTCVCVCVARRCNEEKGVWRPGYRQPGGELRRKREGNPSPSHIIRGEGGREEGGLTNRGNRGGIDRHTHTHTHKRMLTQSVRPLLDPILRTLWFVRTRQTKRTEKNGLASPLPTGQRANGNPAYPWSRPPPAAQDTTSHEERRPRPVPTLLRHCVSVCTRTGYPSHNNTNNIFALVGHMGEGPSLQRPRASPMTTEALVAVTIQGITWWFTCI